MVYLKLQPYCQSLVIAHEVPKLVAKYFRPYKILGKFGNYAYKLDLPIISTIHTIIHVS